MLARIPLNLSEEEVRPAPPSFTATFTPGSITNQFFLSDAEGPVGNLVFVDTNDFHISITLTGGSAGFSPQPIIWTVPPPSGGLPTIDENTVSFTIPKPTHVLRPWVFRISVNTPEVTGILSQSIFLVKPADQLENLFLHYDRETSKFKLSDSFDPTDHGQEGIPLNGQESVLINALNTERTFLVNLQPGSSPPSISFADPPVVWSTRNEPDWISASRMFPHQMQLHVGSPTGELSAGQCIGLRFALEITTAAGTVAVLSPDPILVNTTIGDG